MSWIEESRIPVAEAVRLLGLETLTRETYPCPACHERARDRRGAVGVTRNRMGWKCHLCGEHGDGLDFLAFGLVGRRLREAGEDGRRAVRERLGNAAPDVRPGPRWAAPAPVAPTRARPDDVEAFWARCGPVGRHPYAVDRGYADAAPTLARLTPGADGLHWPEWWPSTRAGVWRLVTRGWTAEGEAVSLHGRAVGPRPMWDGREAPKTLWAKGIDAAGLMFWNQRAASDVQAVIIAEGMTDWLAVAMWAQSRPVAVYGATSGGFAGLRGITVPRGVDIVAAVHEDAAGEAYLREILAAFPRREVRRVRPSKCIDRVKSTSMAAK